MHFRHDTIYRKATRQVVDSWLVSHATAGGGGGTGAGGIGVCGGDMSSPTHGCGQACSSRSGSGATTPVR